MEHESECRLKHGAVVRRQEAAGELDRPQVEVEDPDQRTRRHVPDPDDDADTDDVRKDSQDRIQHLVALLGRQEPCGWVYFYRGFY